MSASPAHPRTRIGRFVRRIATLPLVMLAVAVVLLEEYLWEGLVQLGAWAGRAAPVRALERRIAALPPAGAVPALLAPAVLAVPAKLAAVWLIAGGHAVLGIAMLLAVKLVATAIVARIYTLCEPALSTVGWFVRLRGRILAIKGWAHRKLEATLAWRIARRTIDGIRALAARWRGGRRSLFARLVAR